jgi:HAE1 family hydrophobic/amphiphilic exporter-1
LIKVKFFPGNYVRYHVTVALPSSTPIKRTDTIVRDISKFILALGEKQADSVSGTAGYFEEEDYSLMGGSQYGQAIVTMPERDRAVLPDNPGNDPVKHIDYIRKKLSLYLAEQYPNPGERPKVKVFPESNGIPSGKAVSLRISGENLDRELEVSGRIMEFMNQNPEMKDLIDITDDRAANVNVVRYTPSQEAAYDLGIPPGRITEMIAGALNGITVGNFQTANEEVDLKIRVARKLDMEGLADSGLATPQDIMDIPLVEHSAAPIFLRDVASLEYSSEPDSRGRYNGKSSVKLTADIRSGSDLTSKRVQFLVSQYFNSIARDYPDITLVFSGESEATGKTFNTLFIGLIIAIIAIYLILALQFGDYVQPLIVLTAVSFAIIGVTFGMLISRSLFTLGSLMAVVGLAGITVNNSLILIDFINIRINEGKTMRQAVKDACRARIRPVLLTTITTIMGLLPMAIGIPYKSVEWSPMATTFVAGLSASTLLTLLMIPVEYELATLVKTKIKEWF